MEKFLTELTELTEEKDKRLWVGKLGHFVFFSGLVFPIKNSVDSVIPSKFRNLKVVF